MARIFMTGGEDGSTGSFDSVKGISASTTQKRTGAYSYRLQEGWYANHSFGTALAEVYMRMAIRADGFPSAHHQFCCLKNNANAIIMSADLLPNSQIALRLGGFTGTVLCSGGVIAATVWHCVEIYWKISNTVGVATLKVDGTQVATFSGDTQVNDANANALTFTLGHPDYCMNGYVDDIAINDTTGSVNNSWIGQVGIRPVLVNADGTVTELTPSTGADNYALVDEVPASDADYVSGSTPDDYDLYTVDDAAMPAAGSVSAVKWIARAKVTEDAANITPVIRSESTTEQQSDIALSTSFTVKSLIMDVDPIDDAAWSIAKIAALEIGAAVG